MREKRFSADARFTAKSPKKPVHTKLLLPTNRIKMEYFFPAKSKVKSFYKDGAITCLVSPKHFVRCNLILPTTLPFPYILIISAKWSIAKMEQWLATAIAICNSHFLRIVVWNLICFGYFNKT